MWDGRNITVSPSSFVILLPTTTGPSVTTPKRPAPKPGDKGLSGGAIAGIVIGVLAGVAIIAGLMYYFLFRKHTKKDPTVDPNDNVFEMNRAKGILYIFIYIYFSDLYFILV